MSVEGPEKFSPIPEDRPPVEAQWPDRAVRRFAWLRSGGLVLAVAGALMFVVGAGLPGLAGNFSENGGLALLVTGLAVIVAAVRTRGADPNRAFAPGSIIMPRMWFILTWIAGCGVAAVLLVVGVTDTTEQIIMLIVSLLLMVVGGFWLLRWLSGQVARRWPIDSAAPLRLAPGWTFIWAGVWGLFSTIVALVIESLPVLLLAFAAGVAFTEVPRSAANSLQTIMRVLRNPILIAVVVGGAVIAAPIVEEGVKALGLHWLRHGIRQPADGWLLGLGIGLGFGVLEGAFNLDSANSWFVGSWVRLAALLLHGLATSLTGLGYARSRLAQQRGPLWRGYRNAVILHGLWNASALGLGVAAGAIGVGAFSISWLLACGGLLLVVVLIIFMVRLIRRIAKAGVETSIQEGFQQVGAVLPTSWSPTDYNIGWRFVGSRPEYVFATVTTPASDPPPIQSESETPSQSESASTNAATGDTHANGESGP